MADRAKLLEPDETEGVLVGRDIRKMAVEDLYAAGIERRSRSAAIRAKCLDCCGDSPAEVRRCTVVDCTLWAFRFGADPFREKREMSDEQRQAIAERFARARAGGDECDL